MNNPLLNTDSYKLSHYLQYPPGTVDVFSYVEARGSKIKGCDEVVFFDECYHRSREFCCKHLSRFGVVTRQVKACDYDAMEGAINSRTKLLISESPTNPHLSVVDLERFAAIGRRTGVETLIDATLAATVPHHVFGYSQSIAQKWPRIPNGITFPLGRTLRAFNGRGISSTSDTAFPFLRWPYESRRAGR